MLVNRQKTVYSNEDKTAIEVIKQQTTTSEIAVHFDYGVPATQSNTWKNI